MTKTPHYDAVKDNGPANGSYYTGGEWNVINRAHALDEIDRLQELLKVERRNLRKLNKAIAEGDTCEVKL